MAFTEIIQVRCLDFFLNFLLKFNYTTIVSISSSSIISYEDSGLENFLFFLEFFYLHIHPLHL